MTILAEPVPVITTAYDMKAIVILMCCDIMGSLMEIGDEDGAYALLALVKTIEQIPVLNQESTT